MKTTFSYSIVFTFLLILFQYDGKAQDINKNTLDRILQGTPYLVPLVKQDFQTISSPFGFRKHPVLKSTRLHQGIDLAAPKGSAVIAAASGIAEYVSYDKGYGNTIIIKHPFDTKTRYAHLSAYLIKKGDIVKQGQIIGLVGDTGLATGPHLHYEILVNNKHIDPMILWKTLSKNIVL